jgi:hypothetical protein
VLRAVHNPLDLPDQGGEQGDQAEAVEGGVVTGDGHAPAAGPGHDPERGLGGQVEAVEQGGGVERVAVDDQRLGRRAGAPGLAVEARSGHRDRAVQGLQPLGQPLGRRGQGRGRHHHPGGPPVGEPQDGQGLGRGGRGQARPGGYRRTPRSTRRPGGSARAARPVEGPGTPPGARATGCPR